MNEESSIKAAVLLVTYTGAEHRNICRKVFIIRVTGAGHRNI
jgi:hypothetical protein